MIRHPESHLDHNLSDAIVEYILAKYADKQEFFIDTFELPAELGTVPCNLHGPAVDEEPVLETEVHYVVRPPRTYATRMCKRQPVQTRKVTVIGGPEGDLSCVLYTAFGGPQASREPGDPDLKGEAAVAESIAFWSKHALNE